EARDHPVDGGDLLVDLRGQPGDAERVLDRNDATDGPDQARARTDNGVPLGLELAVAVNASRDARRVLPKHAHQCRATRALLESVECRRDVALVVVVRDVARARAERVGPVLGPALVEGEALV